MDLSFSPAPMDTGHVKRKWLNVPYANKSKAQNMDIYLPNDGDGPFPVIATFHGGAWMFGDKGDDGNRPFLQGLKRGYAVACINYRLSDEAHFPCQIHDCNTAVRYLRTNAANYLLDGRYIGAWGASAGGYLAALLGTADKVRELDDPSLRNARTRFSGRVQAVVVWYGPLESFLKMDEQLSKNGNDIAGHTAANSPESRLLGRQITQIPAMVRFASPMTYIRTSAPPFLIQHGQEDGVVPVQQAINFAAELERIAGSDKVCPEILPEAGHGDPCFHAPENLQRVFDFFDVHLKQVS